MRILVIEDEPAIAALVSRGLTGSGFLVDVAKHGTVGYRLACRHTYAALILDVMLPGMDGFKICEQLRMKRVLTPILMLTAKDAVNDRIRGLEHGADDYLVKPFDFNELLARVRAMLRRDKVNRTRVIRIADLEIDTAAHRVLRKGTEIGLSHREYELLEALAANEGRVLTREAIHQRVWMNDEAYSNMVDVYIRALRRKIDVHSDMKLIHTIRGAGYTLRHLADGELI